jgi:hypothetical protein
LEEVAKREEVAKLKAKIKVMQKMVRDLES